MATKLTDQQKGKGKKEEGLDLEYVLMNVKLNLNDKVASCQLRMPSELPRGVSGHRNDTTVVLDLIPTSEDPEDKDWTHCFKMMKEIVHPSILHVRAIKKNVLGKDCDHWGLVEPFTGILFDFLKKRLGTPLTFKSGVVLLPTDTLRSIVRQIMDGLEHLMIQGYYHGNFSLRNTYYHQMANGLVYVKLGGFKKKGGKKSVCQEEDVFALGDELVLVSTIATDLNKTAAIDNKGPCFDTFLLDDMAKKLKLVTDANLAQTYQEIKGHVFFWEIEHRTKFFVYRVAEAMKTRDNFRSRIAKCEELCALRWDLDDYDGFLQKMNKHRTDNHKKPYDGSSICDFVDFISGLYTHEKLLQNEPQKVDKTVTKRHPHLCLILRNLLGSDDADWL